MMNINSVLDFINSDLSFVKGKRVTVAFSGGADSVSLLHSLYSLKDILNIKLSAVHINHNLRGAESDRDEAFCRDFCESLGTELKVFSIDLNKDSLEGESTEVAARRIRYEIFESLDTDYIATAHTAEDSLETFIINFLRGTGLKGLCGIPKKRGIFIRPLHNFSRADIESYCKENSLFYVTDSSNLTDNYTRNKIRHGIIPKLKEINPSVVSVARRNMELILKDSAFLEDLAEKAYKECYVENRGLLLEKLNKLDFPISSRVIIKYADSILEKAIPYNRLCEILEFCENENGSCQLFKDTFVEVKNGYLSLKIITGFSFSVKTEVVSLEKYKNLLKINNLFLYNAIDCDKISGELVLRKRLPGDKISPLGRKVTKELRKLQNEMKIDNNLRDALPLAADDNGVIWCYKTAVDERVKIDGNTKNVLLFKVDNI